MEKISLTSLRNNIYQIFDNLIQTGIPLEIERNGHKILISLENESNDKFAKLKPHHTINGDPKELINLNVGVWERGKNL